MNKSYLLIFAFIVFGCQLNEGTDMIPDVTAFSIEPASGEHINAFGKWLESGNEQFRMKAGEYDPSGLKKIRMGENVRWAALSTDDPGTSVSFIYGSDGNIDRAFISSSVTNPDKSIISRIYDTQNVLMMEILHRSDGNVSTLYKAPVGTLGWFSEFDYCFGKVLNPFGNTTANVAMGLVFSAATMGMWVPSVALSCAGYGLAKM
jgi:hypothetical protein